MSAVSDVYPPSEDTYLLVDALLPLLPPHPILLLEVGTGSAYVPILLQKDQHCHPNTMFMVTDINPAAVACGAKSTTEALVMDLAGGFARAAFDIVVFNPPYVPTDNNELEIAQSKRDVSASWAGGKFGREIMIRAIKEVKDILAPGGFLVMVALEENKPKELADLGQSLDLKAEIVGRRRAGFENLCVLKFTRLAQEGVL